MVGDPNHLERMGRELKCPICLSLLSSAVSLNCNHVFCNSCIVKSMKSDSNCPVCKVPYRRREVRPVAHMDNLVSIYKSMEIASGMNIFITQNAPSTKSSDGKQQVEDSNIHDGQGGQIFVEKQDTFREQGSRDKCESNLRNFDTVHVKPSFPAKKRVQVPHSQSEGEKEGPGLSPFFWLRDEENVESLTQHTSTDPLSNMPLPDPPTFSDIKDSDDENSSGLIPEGEVLGKSSNVADMFDSEMFEWTQRPCSPELCSSPVKMQVADTKECGVVQAEDLKESSRDKKRGKVVAARKEDDGCTNELPDISPPGTDYANDRAGCRNSKKRGRKAKEIVGATSRRKNSNLALGVNVDSNEKSQDKLKTFKRSKKVRAASLGAKTLEDRKKDTITELPAAMGKRKRCTGDFTSKNPGNNCDKIHVQNQIEHPISSKKQKLDSMQNDSEEVSNGRNHINKDTIAELSALLVPLANKDKTSNSTENSSKVSSKAKSSDHGLRSKRKSKVSCSGNSKDEISNVIQAGSADHLRVTEGHTTGNNKENLDVGSLTDPSTVKNLPPLTNHVVLQRCQNSLSKIQCAFCLSSEESEASGEMVHYYNGRPVAAGFNGGSKVIHSHRNCTEWAPNVYFEDDVAVNLEAELTRSRRIKCSCCGTKGAALGCYEKNCRKSFHVPCAKLMPECRWDTVNFVMLCPLHPSSKFPGECSESQSRKRTSNPKKLSSVQHNKVAVKHDQGTTSNWSSCGSSKKLVLCCSALTISERDVVSKFEKISGITVSKTWESNVTHVIASTDETGACRRTLKVLMGILDGKWILSMKWIKACMEAMKLVDEESFEITVDSHGIRDGPRLGRLRAQNMEPKLLEGSKFYFMGEFEPSYKGYLQDLITAAGGTILHRKPVAGHQKDSVPGSLACQTFIIYSLELPNQSDPTKRDVIVSRRRLDAEALASSSGTKVVSNSWVLNSIAACKLQSLTE